MASLAELLLRDELPNGLHDAHLESLQIDWRASRLVFVAEVWVGPDEERRRARFTVDGLLNLELGAEPSPAEQPANEALWIVEGHDAPPAGFSPPPPGYFFHSLFDTSRNRFISFVAREAAFEFCE